MDTFESYRYPTEMLVTRIAQGAAWFLWAVIGVIVVATTLATAGAALLLYVLIAAAVVFTRLLRAFTLLEHSVDITAGHFPNLTKAYKQWQMRMSDPEPASAFLTADPSYRIILTTPWKRPIVILASGAAEALTAQGSAEPLTALVYHGLAKARLAQNYEWVICLPLYLFPPTILLPLWLSRLRTLSADRVAAAVSSTHAVSEALMTLALGPTIAPAVFSDPHVGKHWPKDERFAKALEVFSSTPRLSTRLARLGSRLDSTVSIPESNLYLENLYPDRQR